MDTLTTKSARPTGSDAKTRRGAGWGGKGSVFAPQPGMTHGRPRIFAERYRRAYRGKDGRGVTCWIDGKQQQTKPHQGEMERWRRVNSAIQREPIEEAAE